MAELANQQGSTFYKDGEFTKAQERYQAAINLDKKVPKYPSNLSAVQYEAGKYSECIKSINTSWTLLGDGGDVNKRISTPPEGDPLAIKLATRFAKANIQNAYSKADKLNKKASDKPITGQKEIDADIERFVMKECTKEDDPKIQDMKTAWEQWRALRDSGSRCNSERLSARIRLFSVPIFKARADPTLEYYTFGHDDVQSFMNGINNTDDYALDSPEYEGRESWSFLFGGSGDARHVFGTIIHLADMADEVGSLEPIDDCQMHMTLMDVHPASLARVIMVMSLVRQILATRISKDELKRIELYATLFYLYGTMLMPNYCHKIVMNTAQALVHELSQKKHSLSKCLHVNEKSLPAILDVLKYWSKPLPKLTKVFLQNRPNPHGPAGDMDDFMASFMGFNSNNPEAKLKAISTKNRKNGGDIYDDPVGERTIFKQTVALVPPKPLLSRHPALAKLVKSYISASDSMYAAVRKEIEQTWKPNPTIFDPHSTEHPRFGDVKGYPLFDGDAYHCITPFIEFVKEFQKGKPPLFCRGTTAFAITAQFFELVANSMWVLQNTLKLEVVVSDVFTGTTRLLAGDLGKRPKEFPDRYSRMWLSNVPDYTHGILTTAVHLTPYLEQDELAMANCLLNTGVWRSLADFCYNYALLLPQDVPRFLGCKVVKPGGLCWDDIILQAMSLPRPLDKLASKKELHTWLAHLLVCTLCSGTPQTPPVKVEMPNNLGAFIHVLIHLRRVGFPSHWIGDFLQSVLADTLVTSAVPYIGKLPIPVSESYKKNSARKINLAPWRADLEVILTLVKDALPFVVTLPSGYPTSADDIHTYSATVDPIHLELDRRSDVWGPLTMPFCPAIGIIFYNGLNFTDVPELLPQILEGKTTEASGELQVMIGVEEVDLSKGVVSWKMSKSWYEKMRREKWRMAAYRTDLKVLATMPLGGERWIEVV